MWTTQTYEVLVTKKKVSLTPFKFFSNFKCIFYPPNFFYAKTSQLQFRMLKDLFSLNFYRLSVSIEVNELEQKKLYSNARQRKKLDAIYNFKKNKNCISLLENIFATVDRISYDLSLFLSNYKIQLKLTRFSKPYSH